MNFVVSHKMHSYAIGNFQGCKLVFKFTCENYKDIQAVAEDFDDLECEVSAKWIT